MAMITSGISMRSNSPSQFAKMVMILLIISPVLECYGWGKFNFAFIVMSLLAVYHLMTNGFRHTKAPKNFFLYLGWWYLSHVLSSSSIGELLPLGLFKIALTYKMFIDIFDLDYFMPRYKTVANLIIAYFYVQEIGKLTVGIHLPSVIPALPIAIQEDAQAYIQSSIESERSSGFFKEPAVFAQFLLPLLCYELLAKAKNNWKYIAFLGITLLWSRAGNAMIGLLAVAVCYLFYVIRFQKGAKKFGIIIFGAVFAIGCLAIFMNTDGGQKIKERADSIGMEDTIDKGYAGSTFLRMYQGLFIFEEYPRIYKLIGNDHDTYITNKALSSPILSKFYKQKDFVIYFNTLYAVLIYTGYIGLILLILFFRDAWKGNTYCGKSILIVLISLFFISSNFFTQIMTFYLLPTLGMKEINNKIK